MTGVSGMYSGGVLWAVRWAETGHEPIITQCVDEFGARSLFQLLRRQHEDGKGIRPELLATRVHWIVQEDSATGREANSR